MLVSYYSLTNTHTYHTLYYYLPVTKFYLIKILFSHIHGLSGLEEKPKVPEVKIHVSNVDGISNVDGVRRHLRLLALTRRLGACAVLCRGTREDQGCISESAQIVLNILVCAMNKPYNYSWLIQLVRIHVASEKVKLFVYQNCLPRKKPCISLFR